MRRILIILIVFFSISACESEPSRPHELINEETYKQMFIEFAIINQLDQHLLKNKSQEELRSMVYEEYGVSEEEFRISHQYYEQQLEEQLIRIREMTRTLRAERDSLTTVEREYQEAIRNNSLDSLRQFPPGNE